MPEPRGWFGAGVAPVEAAFAPLALAFSASFWALFPAVFPAEAATLDGSFPAAESVVVVDSGFLDRSAPAVVAAAAAAAVIVVGSFLFALDVLLLLLLEGGIPLATWERSGCITGSWI